MYPTLFLMRYLFIIISIIGTLYLFPVHSFSVYTFSTLFYLAIDRFQHKCTKTRWEWLFISVQIIYAGFLSSQYHGLMFVLFYANLFALQLRRQYHILMFFILIQWIVMNFLIINNYASILVLANLMYATIVAVLFLVRNMTIQKEEIQLLYDSLRRNHYELDETRSRLAEYAKRVEGLAQTEERNRISKEIHDEIGHKLIRVKMMMEAVIRILPYDKEKGVEMIYQVRDHLSNSMETLRSTVRKLKPQDALVKNFSLKQLAKDFEQDSGVRVHLEMKGHPYTLYPSVEVALYLNTQEAMTNAVRHGQATEITIELNYQPDKFVMTIQNNGAVPQTEIVKGLGLRGMEERLELMGGHIEISAEVEFKIKTILPDIRRQSG